jgi:hypothetical protein
MPIVKDIDSTELEFGYGDIEVAPALLQCDETIGAVCFFQRAKPQAIGERGDYTPNMVVERENTPVRMTFEKVQSIDVVIKALQEAKELMQKKAEGVA